MRIQRGLHNGPGPGAGCVLTIGNFDGVHRGHQALIETARQQARALQLPLTVLSFEPTPREYFAPGQAPGRISTMRGKYLDLAGQGVDTWLLQRFGRDFSRQGAEAFVREVLVARLGVRALVVGDDFRFGLGRCGDLDLLHRMGADLGFTVTGLGSVCLDGLRCSSTAVRAALAEPDLDRAAALLGKPYRMVGRVRGGLRLGRELGMPTANIALHRRPALRLGIYAVRAQCLSSGERWLGVANLGVRPTLGLTRCLLETHVFQDSPHLYGRILAVEFARWQRPEARFDSLEALRVQMHRDKAEAMAFFGLQPDN